MLLYKDGAVEDHKVFFPNVSFPASGPSDEFLQEHNALKVSVFKNHDAAIEKLVPCDVYVEDGMAYTVEVQPKTAEELAAQTQALASQVRAQRDRMLSESDWTQVLDAPVDRTVWANYREALRGLPEQEGFPHNVVWPTKPE